MRKLVLLLICFCTSWNLQAQNNCGAALIEADKLYQRGKFQELINLLEPCLDKGFMREQRFDVYHLLALAYQGNLNEEKAKYFIGLMLKLQPDYKKFPALDPLEFTKLVNTFQIRPLIYIGGKAGINSSGIELKKSYAVYSGLQSYTPTIGFQFGGFGEYFLKTNWSLQTEIVFNRISIQHTLNNTAGWRQFMEESQNYILIHPSIQYYQKIIGNLQVFGGMGFGLNLMRTADIYFQNIQDDGGVNQLATKNTLDERNKNQLLGSVKLGLSYPLGRGVLGIESAYWHFLGNTVNDSKRMNDLNFIFNNQYVADAISIRSLNFSLSYKFPVHYQISQ